MLFCEGRDSPKLAAAQQFEERTVMAELNVVLLQKGTDGRYLRNGEEFGLSDLGGVLPDRGDIIVPVQGERGAAMDRTVYVVEARYFRPRRAGSKGFTNVGLVVSSRQGREDEQHLLSGGG